MNFSPELPWVVLRAALIACAALMAGHAVSGLLGLASDRARRAAWLLLLTPYLTPVPMVGYAYSNFSLSLVRHPIWNLLFYSLLLGLKLAPIAALARHFSPWRLPAESIHCHRLLRPGARGSVLRDLWFELRGDWRATGVALALVFLFAFADFELASLLGVKSWTVSLFDAHVGGLALTESLRRAALPALCQIAALVAAVALLSRARRLPSQARYAPAGKSRVFVFGYLIVALVVVTLIPLWILLKLAVAGLGGVTADSILKSEIASSLFFAAAASALAYVVAGPLAKSRGRLGWTCACSAPGLLGPLILALIILTLFQFPLLRGLYDTPVPLILALTLLFLPFAALLRMLLHVFQPSEALHAAQLLRVSGEGRIRAAGQRIVRHIRTRGRFWILFFLFSWAYFDLTASSILAPVQMTPVFVRLYNLMHYGQIPLLSVMVCLALCVPLVLLGTAVALRALLNRMAPHG